ncbi:spore germination protein [Alkaliphilus transvaalensis]|uniref:spore germination protein n=1 Tax=Alkaliphilus transvaalensis TaxID=114628 RepID=UPI0006846081|nr:spore germination protein [Alkaliphilus transvaalensis]
MKVENYKSTLLSKKLNENLLQLKDIFSDCCDIIYRKLKINVGNTSLDLLMVFTDGLVDTQTINEHIMKPITTYQPSPTLKTLSSFTLDTLKNVITINNVDEVSNYQEVLYAILSGDTVLMVNGFDIGLSLNTKGWAERTVEEPPAESVIRGSREGLTENLSSNVGLIRRKLKDTSLKAKELIIGTRTQTMINVLYMDDLVNKQLLNDLINELESIEIDGIFESGYIEQLIEKHPYSPFPQVQVTERPDKICGNLLEGRIIILVDGAPLSLILPMSFFLLFQSPEDYNERIIFGNLLRLLRFLGFIIATSFPSIYVALISFHQQMLPADLIVDLSKTRAQIPFPPVVEALLMELTIELLREASARLPGTIGQTIGIVGAIVIGDAAVRANIASPAMVIVVAITAIGSYVLPHYSTTYPLRFLRFPMIFMAATFGAFGIIIAWAWIIIHLCSISSFGFPYLSPLAPYDSEFTKDTVLRKPFWFLRQRPKVANKNNRNRWS